MSANRSKGTAVPEKLPRGGRHPLTQEAVAASQRMRMLAAIARAVADKGYGHTTVADVIALAGVSRRTFYEQFPKLEDCFLAAYREGMQLLFGAIRDALRQQPGADWRARTGIAIEAYLKALAEHPEATWTFAVETLGAGRPALEQRAWVLNQWVAQWRALQALREQADPQAPKIADEQLLGIAGGIEEMVRECLRTRGAKKLPTLAPAATVFALAVLAGPRSSG
jgi:AcrR family transcriptional regulator